MFRFQHIQHLYYLAGILLFLLLYIFFLVWRKRKLQTVGEERLVKEQIVGFIAGRMTLKFILLLLSFGAIAIGWANLQKGSGLEKTERKGTDVFIALDVSNSMLANDVQPNRLTRAKQLISTLLDKTKNDRVGLILFAGKSYLQVPLTVDYSALKMMLQNANPGMVPTQGTVIGDAIDRAINSFSQKEKKYKTLIIISDGEDHDETAMAKVKEAQDAGIIIHTVGIGSPEGTTLYDPTTKSMRLDEEGKPIISKLNEDELKSIASAGNGTYSLLRNSDDVATKLSREIGNMEQKNLGVVSYSNYASYFQYFLLFAFLLLVIEWLIPGAQGKRFHNIKKPVATVVLLLFATTVMAQQSQVSNGNKLYEQKKYKEAASVYQEALKKNPNYLPGIFNLGNALYQEKNYDASRQLYSALSKKTKDATINASSHYNTGNTYMSEQKWQEAVESYKAALRKNPQDEDAKYNLSYALSKMKQSQNNNDKNQQQNKDKQDPKNQQDQQDKNNKDQEKNKDQQDPNKEPSQDKNDQQEPKDNKQEPQPSKLSEKQADQLLNALAQEEKKLHDKKEKGRPVKVKTDKDW